VAADAVQNEKEGVIEVVEEVNPNLLQGKSL